MINIKNEIGKITEYHKNPRFISRENLDNLEEWLIQFGDLGVLTVDINTWQVVSGNQRNKIININECIIEDLHVLDVMTKAGTVAWAYVIYNGERFPIRFVKWDEKQVEQAVIIANKSGGIWDIEKLLNEFDNELLLESGWSEEELIGVFDDEEDKDTSIGEDHEDEESFSLMFHFDTETEMLDALVLIETTLEDTQYNYASQVIKK